MTLEAKVYGIKGTWTLHSEQTMEKINEELLTAWLKISTSVGRNFVTNRVKNFDKKIVIDSVGGCAYNSLSKILSQLEIDANSLGSISSFSMPPPRRSQSAK